MQNLDVLYEHLYRWWNENKRILPWRETEDAYRIWLSEIILQQTRVAQGLDYYLRFIQRFPTVQLLAAAHEDEVLRLWQGLGYYTRARNIYKAAQLIVAQGGLMPTTFAGLRQLPGVGDYTAGAIASFAYNLPYPALDGNVYRVLARWFDCDIPFDTSSGKKHFHQLAQQVLDRQHPRLFNSAIMELGALLCTPSLTLPNENTPACETCPVAAFCAGYLHHTAAVLPIRKPRVAPKDRELTYIIYLNHDGQTLIHQRQDNDIWKHLWEFIATPAAPQQGFLLWKGTHILSHLKLHASFYICQCTQLPSIPDTKTVAWHQLDDYALSRLSLRALEHLGTIPCP